MIAYSLYTASDQKLEVGTALERGYGSGAVEPGNEATSLNSQLNHLKNMDLPIKFVSPQNAWLRALYKMQPWII